MKKLAAVLCAIALMLTMAVPAMANKSISDLSENVIEVKTETEVPAGTTVQILPADVDRYDDVAVKAAIASVNNEEAVSTVEEVVTALAEKLPEGTTVSEEGVVTIEAEEGGEDTVIDLKEYDFITTFADLALADGSEVSFDDNGVVVEATVTLAIDVLKDVAPEDLNDYLIVLINPTTGEVCFIKLDPETFNPATGEITVDFPFLGTFALIQKV